MLIQQFLDNLTIIVSYLKLSDCQKEMTIKEPHFHIMKHFKVISDIKNIYCFYEYTVMKFNCIAVTQLLTDNIALISNNLFVITL